VTGYSFFTCLSLEVEAVQVEVPVSAGDLLVFENFALADGRRGNRRPGELRQRFYGHRYLTPPVQRELRDRFSRVFGERQPARRRSAVSVP
jgi:hypothetical protein